MLIRVLIFFLTILSQPLSAESNNEIDQSTGLKIMPGWRLVITHCTSCHSAKIITAQQGTRSNWLKTLRWMQNKQGLRQFNQKTEKQILDYLAKNYPANKALRRINLPASALPYNPWNKSGRKKYNVIILKKKLY